MFAYCLNNPLRFFDISGHLSRSAVDVSTYSGPALPEPTPIISQDEKTFMNMQFGSTTVAHGGCGPVAIYNAMLLLQRGDISFESILNYYEIYNFLYAGGTLGTPISGCLYFFQREGYSIHITANTSQFDSMAESADVCIMWYMFLSDTFPYIGAHYVAFTQTEKNSIYYNLFKNQTEPYLYNGGCISMINEQGYFAPVLITIERK